MAIQWTDPGGEYYFSSGITAAGVWSGSGGASLINNATTGRATQYGIQVATNGHMEKTIGSFATLVMGGAFFIPTGSVINANTVIMSFIDTATTQVDLRIDATGRLFFTRNGTTIGGTSTNTFAPGLGWHYIEMQSTINSTTGTAQVWVDNVSWLSITGQNTQATGNATANQSRWGSCFVGGSTSVWKDVYVLDTGTGTNTARLGDITVAVEYPNAAGTNQQWTNNGGASQTVSVQDGIGHTGTWPDGDTTYISDSVSGHISDFAHQAIGTGSIYAVMHASYLRSDAGAVNANQIAISGGTTRTTANIALGASYNYFYDIMEVDPNTSALWTVTNYNNATFGIKVT